MTEIHLFILIQNAIVNHNLLNGQSGSFCPACLSSGLHLMTPVYIGHLLLTLAPPAGLLYETVIRFFPEWSKRRFGQ
jgi:hypothetical protein